MEVDKDSALAARAEEREHRAESVRDARERRNEGLQRCPLCGATSRIDTASCVLQCRERREVTCRDAPVASQVLSALFVALFHHARISAPIPSSRCRQRVSRQDAGALQKCQLAKGCTSSTTAPHAEERA